MSSQCWGPGPLTGSGGRAPAPRDAGAPFLLPPGGPSQRSHVQGAPRWWEKQPAGGGAEPRKELGFPPGMCGLYWHLPAGPSAE